MLNVLHISDLHYSAAPGRVRDAAVAATNGILVLAKDLKSKGVLGGGVCLCITGDLVQTGETPSTAMRSDYDEVQEKFLAPLLKILEIGPDRVFLVPGNHEMDRNAVHDDNKLTVRTSSINESRVHADLVTKLGNFFDFVEQNQYQSVTRTSPRLATFCVGDQTIACINGLAGSYSRSGTGDKGELFILNSELGGIFTSIAEFSIVLMHHPFSWFDDRCATDIKDFLSARRCRILTGHIHDKGVELLETGRGTLAVVQAGAAAESGKHNDVAVGWYPKSNSAAVRHYSFDIRLGAYPDTPVEETHVAPQSAEGYFQKTEAYFDIKIVEDTRAKAGVDCHQEFRATFGRELEKYVAPDLAAYSEDQFSAARIGLATFQNSPNRRVVSGDELSGKTSLIYYSAVMANTSQSSKSINIVFDFRALSYGKGLMT